MPRPDPDIIAAVALAVRADGARFTRGPLIERLLAKGVARSSAYRAIDRALATGEARQALADFERGQRAAVEIEVRQAQAAVAVAAQGAETALATTVLPPSAGFCAAELFKMLRTVTDVTEQVIRQSMDDTGRVKLIKIALAATKQLRDSVETYATLTHSIYSAAQVHKFVSEIMGLLRDISTSHPEAARDIAVELQGITNRWQA